MEIMKKFEARWLEEEECHVRVEQAWVASVEKGDSCMLEIQEKS